MRRLAFLALLAAGCFSPDYKSGVLRCSPAGECPEGFSCIADRCYKAGEEPDLAAQTDLGSLPDLVTLPDLTPPPPIVVPPAAVFVSSGGGNGKATSGTSLNLCVPGVSVGGVSTAPSGATLNFGYFSNDSIE